MKTKYKNRLPHLTPIGATFFVTFRLEDSLPFFLTTKLQKELKEATALLLRDKPNGYKEQIKNARKRNFAKYDIHLARKHGKCYLENSKVAQIIKEKLHDLDGDKFDLLAYCIMPNHVHILIDTAIQITDEEGFIMINMPSNYTQLDVIMQLIKGSTSRFINQFLNREGVLWQKDSYDHYTRNEKELINILNYILLNPVKAKMVKNWEDFPHSYVNLKLIE